MTNVHHVIIKSVGSLMTKRKNETAILLLFPNVGPSLWASYRSPPTIDLTLSPRIPGHAVLRSHTCHGIRRLEYCRAKLDYSLLFQHQ